MSFIRETIKSKTKVKKGFTIIEVIVVLSIISIIINISIIVLSKYMKLHREEINYSRESFYVSEAFTIIENEIKIAKYIDIKDNMIILRRYDNAGYDYIRENKGTSIVISYGAVNSSNVNNVLKNIEYFSLERYEKVLYISIKMKRGEPYRRCFAIEREKVRKDSY